ncbi:hypothetical protein ONE63_002215 [Megalurothrips usitatus]|uniref:FLYWCH-type domain-containing protein n=1 Tax=Megalurothrips usitatus TaxID=439358 RepID=A0AAV7X7H1_9NEOP|nr:hypothetical protein ONE63_002215 [Megalurothrips usitatus]
MDRLVKFAFFDGATEKNVYWDRAGKGYNLRHRYAGNRAEFRCRLYNSTSKCTASVVTDEELRVESRRGVHSCPWGPEDTTVFQTVEGIKKMSEGLHGNAVRQIFHREANRLPAGVRCKLSAEVIVEALIKRAQRANPPEPTSMAHLCETLLDPRWRNVGHTIDLEDGFFQGVVGPPGHQSAVFASPRLVAWHRQRQDEDRESRVLMDTTYYTAPCTPPGIAGVHRLLTVDLGRVRAI